MSLLISHIFNHQFVSVSPLQTNFSFNCISVIKDSPDTSHLAPEVPIAYSCSILSYEIIAESTSLASCLYSHTKTPDPDVRAIWLRHPWTFVISDDATDLIGEADGPAPFLTLPCLPFPHKAAHEETLANKQAGKHGLG